MSGRHAMQMISPYSQEIYVPEKQTESPKEIEKKLFLEYLKNGGYNYKQIAYPNLNKLLLFIFHSFTYIIGAYSVCLCIFVTSSFLHDIISNILYKFRTFCKIKKLLLFL